MDNFTSKYILSEWKKDCKWDVSRPQDALMEIPSLHSKYLEYLERFRDLAKREEYKLVRLKNEKIVYYRNQMPSDEWKEKGWDAPDRKLLRSDIDAFVNKDQELLNIIAEKDKYEAGMNVCDKILQELKSRHFDIKTYVDWQKYINGA